MRTIFFFLFSALLFSFSFKNENLEFIAKTNLSNPKINYASPVKFEDGLLISLESYEKPNSGFYPPFYKIYFSDDFQGEEISTPKKINLIYQGENDFKSNLKFHSMAQDYLAESGEIFFSSADYSNHFNNTVFSALFTGTFDGFEITNIQRLDFIKKRINFPHCTISSDGLNLVFNSDETGTFQLYKTKRNTIDAEWETPRLIKELNDEFEKFFPKFISDSILTFSQKNEAEDREDWDLFFTEKINNKWTFPESIEELNSFADDFSIELTSDSSGYFSRANEFGRDEILYFEKLKIFESF